jgi:hypothetical protein
VSSRESSSTDPSTSAPSTAAREQLGGALQTGERIAQLVREALERGVDCAGQRERWILAGELGDRVRLQPPAAALARRQRRIGETLRLAGERERQPAQADGFIARGLQPVGQAGAVGFERRQRQAREPARADPEPAAERRIGAGEAAVGTGPGDRGRQRIQGVEGVRIGHCTNIVQIVRAKRQQRLSPPRQLRRRSRSARCAGSPRRALRSWP